VRGQGHAELVDAGLHHQIILSDQAKPSSANAFTAPQPPSHHRHHPLSSASGQRSHRNFQQGSKLPPKLPKFPALPQKLIPDFHQLTASRDYRQARAETLLTNIQNPSLVCPETYETLLSYSYLIVDALVLCHWVNHSPSCQQSIPLARSLLCQALIDPRGTPT